MQVTMKFVFHLIFSLLLQFYIAFLDETPAIYEYQCILWHQLWYFIGHKSEKSHHIKQQHDILWLLSLINDLLCFWLCPWSLAEIHKGQKGGQKAEWQDLFFLVYFIVVAQNYSWGFMESSTSSFFSKYRYWQKPNCLKSICVLYILMETDTITVFNI